MNINQDKGFKPRLALRVGPYGPGTGMIFLLKIEKIFNENERKRKITLVRVIEDIRLK